MALWYIFCSAMQTGAEAGALLVRHSGELDGKRYPLFKLVSVIGRHPACDIILDGSDASVVSSQHAEIRQEAHSYYIHDLDSTNGTFVDGERIQIAALRDGSQIRFGTSGPEFTFAITAPPVQLDRTLVLPGIPASPEAPPPAATPQDLLTDAIGRARKLRHSGIHGQTTVIMRDMLSKAIRRSARRHKLTILALTLALIGVSGYSFWRFRELRDEKSGLDREIESIELLLEKGDLPAAESEALLGKLNEFEQRARQVQENMFYKLGPEVRHPSFVEREIRTLLEEFGADSYSIPPQFIEEVERFIRHYQTVDRGTIEPIANKHRRDFSTMRQIFRQQKLPPDLAYMVLIESRFVARSVSSEGAAGLWQFTPETARGYGLRVDKKVDERYDLRKSTGAAARFLRELILDFGAGSSVMLALAAYNVGPAKVRQAVRRVEDPIKQRNFWYLYRARALPLETRQYVPKTLAAMIIGRNLEQFGF
jgi:hypothetical protein